MEGCIGIGIIIEARIRKIKTITRRLDSDNFTHLTTMIIGVLALLAGVFSFPLIAITTPGFLAIKGIVSLIAIAVIIIQTWLIE